MKTICNNHNCSNRWIGQGVMEEWSHQNVGQNGFFSFVPIIDMVLTHKSKHCCKRRAYGVIGNASSQQNINFCKIHKENLDLMNMYCLYCCGIFPWPTSWKLLWHDGNQHLLNYDTWLVVHACMNDLCSLFAPHVISPHHRCQILITKHLILFYLSTNTHYQQDACQKTGQKSKHVSKFQRRKKQPTKALLWQIGPKLNLAKGKTCKKMLRQVSQKKVQVMHLVFPQQVGEIGQNQWKCHGIKLNDLDDMVVVGVKRGDTMPSALKCLIEWVFLVQKIYFYFKLCSIFHY